MKDSPATWEPPLLSMPLPPTPKSMRSRRHRVTQAAPSAASSAQVKGSSFSSQPGSQGSLAAWRRNRRRTETGGILWMDEIHFAPPRKPWLKPQFVGIYGESGHSILGWCKMDFVHQFCRRGLAPVRRPGVRFPGVHGRRSPKPHAGPGAQVHPFCPWLWVENGFPKWSPGKWKQ